MTDLATAIRKRGSVKKHVKYEFDEIQGQIEMFADNADLESQYAVRSEFEDEYFAQVALAKKIIYDNDDNSSNASSSHNTRKRVDREKKRWSSEPNQDLTIVQGVRESKSNNLSENQNVSHIKLPTVNLPRFSGIYQNCLEFRDTFRSIIHDNNSISSVQKFHYLRASLESDASLIIKSLEISSANYELAWNALLLPRYDNNKLLIHNHIKALFNGESIHRENASGLRKLIDDFSKNLRALEQLKQPVKEWDALIVYIISTKLDNVTLREADMLEMVAQSSLEKRRGYNGSTTRCFLTTEPVEVRCVICGGAHYAQNCKDLLKLTPMEREKKERTSHLDTTAKCVAAEHVTSVTKNIIRCCTANRVSQKDSVQNRNDNVEKASEVTTTSGKSSVTLSACGSVDYVFLSTAYVQVTAHDGSAHIIRALLDCGAQSSFVTKDLIKILKVNTISVDITVRGLNNVPSNIFSKCEMNVQSLYNNYSLNQWFFVIDTIAGNIPAVNVDVSKPDIPDHINLADPMFFKPNKIDMLIGSNMFWGLLCVGQIPLGPNNQVLQKTKFGWIVSGPIDLKCSSVICNFAQSFDNEPEVQKCLVKFLEIEEVPSKPSKSADEIACEEHFINTTKRDKDGRFIVTLAIKLSVEHLGDSFEIAKKRFLSLELKCLFQLADKNAEKYPKLANIIRSDFYVDDLLSGADNLEEAANICAGVSAILKQGGFQLRKFYSNNKDVLKYVDVTSVDFSIRNFEENLNTSPAGRLNYSQFPFEKKHPSILSSQSYLAQLVVRRTHLRLLHAGPQHTLAAVREEYWIVGGRTLVKQIVRKCIPCFKYRPKLIKPIMAPLPEMRLSSRQPFEIGLEGDFPQSVVRPELTCLQFPVGRLINGVGQDLPPLPLFSGSGESSRPLLGLGFAFLSVCGLSPPVLLVQGKKQEPLASLEVPWPRPQSRPRPPIDPSEAPLVTDLSLRHASPWHGSRNTLGLGVCLGVCMYKCHPPPFLGLGPAGLCVQWQPTTFLWKAVGRPQHIAQAEFNQVLEGLYVIHVTVQMHTVQVHTTQRNATQRNATQRNATQRNATQRNRQDKTRQDKTRQDKTRQDKTRQDKTRQDKTIQYNI
ncbi:hypothetical protein NQ318_017236 [Aromia moschata]|uniref:Integrase zinc-binding domain-containing protein n=1 Tax=Aromia moschata TaxID=1265417 RepID=A0AAV8YNS1_9CUCU|nr:hypothetical protein NQ318_017236 [Aromia moschata]